MLRTHTQAAAVAVTGLGMLVLGVAAPASAHVTLDPSTTDAGAMTVLTLEVPHGCAGSPTTELAVRMPDQVTDVSVEDLRRWTATVTDEGVAFRPDRPLPDGAREQVSFSVRMPDEVGAELVFPVVQRCEAEEAAWTEVGEDAAARAALERPAPVIVVTAVGVSEARGATMTYAAAGLLGLACLASGAVLLGWRRRA